MADFDLAGSCLCGGVRYRARGPLAAVARCHCDQCRKASGGEFATNGSVDAADFELLAGEELLSRFESSPGNWRVFCSRCGSPVLKRVDDRPDIVRIRLGLLDTEQPQEPVLHVFVAEKPGWSRIDDDLPRFDTLPEMPD